MAAKSQRLQVVVDLAQRQLDDAATRLAKVRDQLSFEQRRCEELENYFTEYQAQAKQQWGKGISVSRLTNFNYFLNNLRQAIDQQRQTITHIEAKCEQARLHWINMKAKQNNMVKLQTRAVLEEEAAREKRLQREIDDNFSILKNF
ncbi:MAG TPA: flagellar export protein FliJ [Pseudomonadales bacterium]|nr:flagellar export protein FliJ [Pseudomonadales bacterium]